MLSESQWGRAEESCRLLTCSRTHRKSCGDQTCDPRIVTWFLFSLGPTLWIPLPIQINTFMILSLFHWSLVPHWAVKLTSRLKVNFIWTALPCVLACCLSVSGALRIDCREMKLRLTVKWVCVLLEIADDPLLVVHDPHQSFSPPFWMLSLSAFH